MSSKCILFAKKTLNLESRRAREKERTIRINVGFLLSFPNDRLFQKPLKRPDAVQTFDYLAKLGLWNGNSDSIHENSTGHRKNYLQSQLTQVTDELNQLKLQLSTSPKETTALNQMSFECGSFASSTVSQSPNGSFDLIDVEQQSFSTTTASSSSMSVKTQVGCLSENDDKDRQISLLTDKLNESDKEANELRKEVERLRDIIKQRMSDAT